MPPKQASLHAFFGSTPPAKRARTEYVEPQDTYDVERSSVLPIPTTAPAPEATPSPSDSRASHRYNPCAPSRSETRAHTDFTRLLAPKSQNGLVKYTPLELQILQLKKEHPGVLLLVEVGYKMKFYQEDAHIASQLLNIVRVVLNAGMLS